MWICSLQTQGQKQRPNSRPTQPLSQSSRASSKIEPSGHERDMPSCERERTTACITCCHHAPVSAAFGYGTVEGGQPLLRGTGSEAPAFHAGNTAGVDHTPGDPQLLFQKQFSSQRRQYGSEAGIAQGWLLRTPGSNLASAPVRCCAPQSQFCALRPAVVVRVRGQCLDAKKLNTTCNLPTCALPAYLQPARARSHFFFDGGSSTVSGTQGPKNL